MRNISLWFLILAVAVAVMLQNVTSKQTVLDHSAGIYKNSRNVLIDVMNAETGQRGFVITGNDTYLDSYKEGSLKFESDLGLLKSFTGNDDPNTQIIDKMGHMKLTEMTQSIQIRKEKGFEAAKLAMMDNVGVSQMSALRKAQGILQAKETVDIANIKTEFRREIKFSQYILLFALLLSVISIIFSRHGIKNFWKKNDFPTES